ncbi:MAG: S8 family peptidase [Blautia sp.]
MENQKLENLLNLALDATAAEREQSPELNIGYNQSENTWDLIIKYTGNLSDILGEDVPRAELLNGFAVITLEESRIEALSRIPGIEYIEKPKRLFFAVQQGRSASCMTSVQSAFSPLGEPLTGKGILVACIDSGVDYAHPDFRDPDGSTRILRLWDQSIPGRPPRGYSIGTEYTQEEINQALLAENRADREKIVPSRDLSGHGTGVLGIAAGNGRASDGVYRGVAYESELLVVKLGTAREGGFPRTTELLQGIDYAIRLAADRGQPVALNLSFGNNYGSHSGESLLETYLDNAALNGRSVICVGMGNEGNQALHTSGRVSIAEATEILLNVGEYEPGFNIQFWKHYVDEMEIELLLPGGQRIGPFQEILGAQRFSVGNMELLLYYGEPAPYSLSQEIYIELLPKRGYVDSGTWKIRLIPVKIVDGDYDLWLPGGGILNEDTHFLFPTPQTTQTIPSTAQRVISVGAYDSRYLAYADFSGRGYTRVTNEITPDLVAPGVGIVTAALGGGYESRTGTSFATPFVTGAAALLMEWGIVRENDPFLYGEKVKAYLRRGARPLLGGEYPNNRIGYGALCLSDSFPKK